MSATMYKILVKLPGKGGLFTPFSFISETFSPCLKSDFFTPSIFITALPPAPLCFMGEWEFLVANINDGYLGLDGKSFVLTTASILVLS